jgi:hypothetical protein
VTTKELWSIQIFSGAEINKRIWSCWGKINCYRIKHEHAGHQAILPSVADELNLQYSTKVVANLNLWCLWRQDTQQGDLMTTTQSKNPFGIFFAFLLLQFRQWRRVLEKCRQMYWISPNYTRGWQNCFRNYCCDFSNKIWKSSLSLRYWSVAEVLDIHLSMAKWSQPWIVLTRKPFRRLQTLRHHLTSVLAGFQNPSNRRHYSVIIADLSGYLSQYWILTQFLRNDYERPWVRLQLHP